MHAKTRQQRKESQMHIAEKTAREVANEWKGGIVVDIRLCRDTAFGDAPQCYVIGEERFGAVVIYLDEPNTVVSTGNYPGRFQAEG
jgi:hypothetical protein